MHFPIAIPLVLIGLSAITGQIVLMRELLVVFYGNELSTAIILTSWLLWSAFGSFCSGKITDSMTEKKLVFALIQTMLAFLLPLTVVAVRLAKGIWKVPLGETVAFDQMLAISFTVLAPFCFLSGFLFALGCGLYAETARTGESPAGRVYWLDALGAGLGGMIFAGLLVNYLNHLQTSLLISAFLLCSSILCAPGRRPGNEAGRLQMAAAMLVAAAILLAAVVNGGQWEKTSRDWQWHGSRLLATTDTHYGNLAAVALEDEISFYENGLWMFSHPDPLSAEEAVHFALLAHPEPHDVLLVGGGLSSTLAETLKHPGIGRVDYVEMDPRSIDFGKTVLPGKAVSVLDDDRVRVFKTDGRRYMNTTGYLYDVIIVDLPDPKTAQLNRFYTAEFFTESLRVLKPGGLIAASLTSSESIIGPTLARSLSSLYHTMKEAYPHITVLPGSTARFFASRQAGSVQSDPEVLSKRIKDRDLNLSHVQDYYILYNLSPGRVKYFENIIKKVPDVKINKDLSPSCYFYDLIHWSSLHAPWIASMLRFFEKLGLKWMVLVPALIFVLIAAVSVTGKAVRKKKPALILSCFVTGYSEMVLSVLLIVVFQIYYGSLYYRVAFLIALHMVGMAVGSRYMIHLLERILNQWKALILVQTAMALYSLFLLGAITILYATHPGVRLFPAMEAGFGLWAFAAGFLGGIHFPLASSLLAKDGGKAGKTGGTVYSLDLGGSAVGAIFAGLILLPVFGIPITLILLFFWNIMTAAALIPGLRHP